MQSPCEGIDAPNEYKEKPAMTGPGMVRTKKRALVRIENLIALLENHDMLQWKCLHCAHAH